MAVEPGTHNSFELNCTDSKGNTIEILTTDLINILVDNTTYSGTISYTSGVFYLDGITDENTAHTATITINKEGYSQYTFTVSLGVDGFAATVNVTLIKVLTLSDRLQIISDSKKAIKAAIEAKGVTDVGDKIADYAGKIESIESGGGNDYVPIIIAHDSALMPNIFGTTAGWASFRYFVYYANNNEITTYFSCSTAKGISGSGETFVDAWPNLHIIEFPKTGTIFTIKRTESAGNYSSDYEMQSIYLYVINKDGSTSNYTGKMYKSDGTVISKPVDADTNPYWEWTGLDLSKAQYASVLVTGATPD